MTNLYAGSLITNTNTVPITNGVTTIWNGPVPAGMVTGPMAQAVMKPPFKPKPSAFGKALTEAVEQATESSVWTAETHTFRILSGNDAINIFGKLRPHMNLRPKKWAEMLLRTCPAPTNAYSKTAQYYYYQGVCAGLMYALPLIYGSKRTRFRLTASGIVLLDYYADRWPDFAPYVRAYLPQKAREEIQVDTCDFIMGIEPEWLKKEKEKAEAAKIKFTELQRIKEQARIQEYMQRAMQAEQNHVWTSAINTVPSTNIIGSAGSVVITDDWANYQNALLSNQTANTYGLSTQTGTVSNSTWAAVQAAAKRLAGKK